MPTRKFELTGGPRQSQFPHSLVDKSTRVVQDCGEFRTTCIRESLRCHATRGPVRYCWQRSASVSQLFATADQSDPSFPPVLMVTGASIYKNDGKTTPDEAGVKKNRERLEPVDEFLTYLGHKLDDDSGTVDLSVPYEKLRDWARAGALLEPPETPGRVARVWISTGFACVVLKFKMRGVHITPDVSNWLSRLAASVRNDYSEPLKKGGYAGQYSNVYPWAAATNALCALVNNDRECTRFQNQAWNNMIPEIRKDGCLPGELSREGRALIYHMKAASGLLVLLDARRALGIPDDPTQIAQFKKLLNRIGETLRDPEPMAAAAGRARIARRL